MLAFFLEQQGVVPVVGRIVEWIIEHPDECSTAVADAARWNDGHESDTDSISTTDTMEGGSSSVNEITVNINKIVEILANGENSQLKYHLKFFFSIQTQNTHAAKILDRLINMQCMYAA